MVAPAVQAVTPRVGPRVRAGALSAGLLSACVGAHPAWALQSSPDSAVTAQGDPVRVSGRVMEIRTEEPVSGATVRFVHLESDRLAAQVLAGPMGAFALPLLAPGVYVVYVEHLGFGRIAESVSLTAGAEMHLTVSLVPEALELEPVVVTVERRTTLALQEFERRRAMGIGSFVTRADIENVRPFQVTDIFRRVVGVQVVPDARGDGRLVLRGRCRPEIYIDGIHSDPTMSLDFSLQPHDVEAIEVYSTAAVPAQYAHNACGVVLVWTRVPERVSGRGSWWKPLVIVTGIMGALIFVS